MLLCIKIYHQESKKLNLWKFNIILAMYWEYLKFFFFTHLVTLDKQWLLNFMQKFIRKSQQPLSIGCFSPSKIKFQWVRIKDKNHRENVIQIALNWIKIFLTIETCWWSPPHWSFQFTGSKRSAWNVWNASLFLFTRSRLFNLWLAYAIVISRACVTVCYI
jgi:hypothetical protein